MKIALGFDPDLKATAGAVVALDDKGELTIVDTQLFTPPVKLKGQQASAAMCAELSVKARSWTMGMEYPVHHIVAEGQQVHRATKNWDSITALGPISGACLAATIPAIGGKGLRASIPTPREWTGGIPKHVRQARMWTALGEKYEVRGSGDGRYAVPMSPEARRGHNVGDWKHLGDAVGLAIWGLYAISD